MNNKLKMVTVNGHQITAGCLIDSHAGQYAICELSAIARLLGWLPLHTTDDPVRLRAMAEAMEGSDIDESGLIWEHYIEAGDDIISWLNDRTDRQYLWGWYEGEIFLDSLQWWTQQYDGDEDDDDIAYVEYMLECEEEQCIPHDRCMWTMHGKPKGPLG
jgi:hypothetical protein